MDEMIGLGLYQSCGSRDVARVSMFELRWCGLYWWVVDRWHGPGSGGVEWFYVCVSPDYVCI